MTFIEYEKLVQEIWEHNRRYYVEHNPTLSDQEFDKLLQHLQHIENEHPDWILPSSPTQRVGETLTEGFKTVIHRTPMLSLANTYSQEEISDFIERVLKLTGGATCDYSCELKMDGIAISAIYENGQFVQGITRGDGKKGDDITSNMKTIRQLPLKLKGDHFPEVLEIKGEVFMSHEVFKSLNEEKMEADEPLWANPRNAAAGSLKLLDPKEVVKRKLSIVFYGLADDPDKTIKTQTNCHDQLKKWGLPTLEYQAKAHDTESIWAFTEKVREVRSSLKYDIDGVVIKVDDLKEQKKLGNTAKNPRWAIAYKFAAVQAKTRVLDITVQVGRSGILTPVAELAPVFVSGSTIARATLHNADEVERKGIRIGDLVTIEKGGDVIPKVVSVDVSARSANTIPWHMPAFCPSCHTPVIKVEGEVATRCPNALNCPEQRLRSLVYFVGKAAMDIDNLGEKVVEQLVKKGFINKPSDIYRLKQEDLYQLDGFKDKSVNNLLSSIEKSKHVSLSRFIMALGIKHVGSTTADLLAQKSGTIEKLQEMGGEDLLLIDGIGGIVAHSVVDYFKEAKNKQEIHDLLALGVNPKEEKVITFHDHLFKDKIFVLTGSLANYTRDAAASLIKARGGKVASSVSAKTDYLLAGEAVGSKFDKAKQLQVTILSEDEFVKLL